MLKKTILITLFILFTGILIYGAVNRTVAKTDDSTHPLAEGTGANRENAEASNGERQYRNRQEQLPPSQDTEPLGRQNNGRGGNQDSSRLNENSGPQGGQGRGWQGSQPGNGQGQQGSVDEAVTHDYVTLKGIVTQAPAAGVDLLLRTGDGQVQIGTGPGYLDEMGFVIQVEDSLSVTGFWEDGEFKATEITRQTDGASIALRDELGRPMWSGAVRNGGQGGRGASRATGQ